MTYIERATRWQLERKAKNRKDAMKWVVEQKGELKIMLGELVLSGFVPERAPGPAGSYSHRTEFSHPDNYNLAFRLVRDHNPNRKGHKTKWIVHAWRIGWTSGKHKDPTTALRRYLDKWWRYEDQEKGVG